MINVDKIIVLHYKPLVNRKTLSAHSLKTTSLRVQLDR